MNWLAHLVLSEPQPEFRIGNVLADILPITELRRLPPAFQAGVEQHRAIDSFTDKHPVFLRSRTRLDPKFRRLGGVIIDIFYDHLLTARWNDYSDTPLDEFVEQFHSEVESHHREIPAGAYSVLRHMRLGEWLTSYGDLEGVRVTLNRIGKRLRRPTPIGDATTELEAHYDELDRDFAEFFPQIQARFV